MAHQRVSQPIPRSYFFVHFGKHSAIIGYALLKNQHILRGRGLVLSSLSFPSFHVHCACPTNPSHSVTNSFLKPTPCAIAQQQSPSHVKFIVQLM